VQASGTYLLHKLSYSRFYVENRKFSLPWQQGSVRTKLTDIELANPENRATEPKITTLSDMQLKLWHIFWKNSQFFVTVATGVV